MWARGQGEEEHPKYDIYRHCLPLMLLRVALWHQPSHWTQRGLTCGLIFIFISLKDTLFGSHFSGRTLQLSGSQTVQCLLFSHRLCDRLCITPTSHSCTNVPDGSPRSSWAHKTSQSRRIIYQSDSGAPAGQRDPLQSFHLAVRLLFSR